MVDSISVYFGAKKRRVAKKSPGRKPKRGHMVRKLTKEESYIVVGGRTRRLRRGANGGLYYRTKGGRTYVPAAVLRRKGHVLSPSRKKKKARKSPKRRRSTKKSPKRRRSTKKSPKRRRSTKKSPKRRLLQTKAAKARRAAYRKAKRARFGLY